MIKNKFTVSRLGIAIFLVLVLNGCSKNEKTDTKGKISDIGKAKASTQKPATLAGAGGVLDYYSFITQPSNGVFGLKSYGTRNQQSNTRTTFVGGSFVDANNNPLPGGPVSIGSISLVDSVVSGTDSYGLSSNLGPSLFGNNTTFNINPNPDGSVTGKNATATLYAPALIYFNALSSGSIIEAGATLTWNGDPLNPQNVLIVIEYDPGLAANASKAAQYPNPITTALSVPDIGSYQFVDPQFNPFPLASTLSVKLIRLNYARVTSTDGTNTYLIYSYNGVEALFFYPLAS